MITNTQLLNAKNNRSVERFMPPSHDPNIEIPMLHLRKPIGARLETPTEMRRLKIQAYEMVSRPSLPGP